MATSLLRQFKTAVQLRTGWRDVLDSWNVETVLVPPSCALAQALVLDPDWHAAFSDSKAIILLRTHPTVENAAISRETCRRSGKKVKKCFPEPSRICETKARTDDWFRTLVHTGSVYIRARRSLE